MKGPGEPQVPVGPGHQGRDITTCLVLVGAPDPLTQEHEKTHPKPEKHKNTPPGQSRASAQPAPAPFA